MFEVEMNDPDCELRDVSISLKRWVSYFPYVSVVDLAEVQ